MLSSSTLQPLDKLQNIAMRIILGCPMSTRTVSMRNELDLPPMADHIKQTVMIFSVKLTKFQTVFEPVVH